MDELYDLYLYDFGGQDLVVKVPNLTCQVASEMISNHWDRSATHDAYMVLVDSDNSALFEGQTITVMTPEQLAANNPFEGGEADVDDLY